VTWILHADVDAFFASVEQARDPSLQGRPVIVGGDGEQHTVVASCSYEARARGVRNAMSTREARDRCPEAVFRPGDSRVYREASDAVWARIARCSPRVQRVALDGGYADLGAAGIRSAQAALVVAVALCREVREELRLPLSAGLGSTRLLARVATDLAKPRGCFLVLPGYERALLRPLPVSRLPGVGTRTARILESFRVRTVGDLACVPEEILVRTFGSRGLLLHQRARGIDPTPVAPGGPVRSLSRETSLEPPIADHGRAFGLASYLLERAMKEAIAAGLVVPAMELRIRHVDGVAVRGTVPVRPPARHEANLIPMLEGLLKRLWMRRIALAHLHVSLLRLRPRPQEQPELFPDPGEERWVRVQEAVRGIRERHGFGAILRGPAIGLLHALPRDRDGFRLRIPSLTR
jgi:DNA polymerase-4